MRIVLTPPSGFDLRATVTSHGWYQLAPFRWDEAEGVLSHVDVYDDLVVELRAHQTARRVIVESSHDVPREEIVARVGRMLQLGVDLSDFHRRCRESETLRDIPERRAGRLLCAPTVFEDAIKIILTTNTRWARTVETNRLLVEHFGSGPDAERAFPRPSDLAAVSEREIRELARVGYRARSIHELSRRLAEGVIRLDERPGPETSSYDELYDWYLQFPGIGPYGAAHMMAMDGRHDRIAVDTEFRSWVRRRYHEGRKVSDATMLRHYRGWGPWKYLAYWCEMSAAPEL